MLLYRYERNGLLVLIILITSLGIFPRFFIKKEHDFVLIPQNPVVSTPPIEKNEAIETNEIQKKVVERKPPVKLELNTADSVSLVKIKGIGPYYAAKIIAYRTKLGGYYSIEQLKELKMTYFNVDSLAHLFTVNRALIKKKELSGMSFKEVLSHPYLEYEDVRMIFNAQRKYGIVSFDTLQKRGVLPDYILRKIRPYFK